MNTYIGIYEDNKSYNLFSYSIQLHFNKICPFKFKISYCNILDSKIIDSVTIFNILNNKQYILKYKNVFYIRAVLRSYNSISCLVSRFNHYQPHVLLNIICMIVISVTRHIRCLLRGARGSGGISSVHAPGANFVVEYER